ncbi:MAG: TMEM165/GDT1 family protein [Pseudomonadota bacterium]
MELKAFLTVFGTIFLAELGDKTQIATMLFAANQNLSKALVFTAAALALVFSAALGVAAGDVVSRYVDPRYLHYVAGVGFVLIGFATLYSAASS